MADIFESEVIQSDTGPLWHIGVPSIDVDGIKSGYEDLTNYTCTMVYTGIDSTQKTVSVVTKNTAGDRFLAQLTSTETNDMNVGINRVVIQIKDDAGTPYRSEVQIDLTVKQQRYIET